MENIYNIRTSLSQFEPSDSTNFDNMYKILGANTTVDGVTTFCSVEPIKDGDTDDIIVKPAIDE